MKDPRRLYKELGNLFYAIAAADKHIRHEEKKALDDEIQFAWKHYDDSDNGKDRFGTDRAYLIQFEFETMEDEVKPAAEAYKDFETFFKEFQEDFDNSSRKRIFNSAKHIAESARRINKPELAYLEKLKKLLNI